MSFLSMHQPDCALPVGIVTSGTCNLASRLMDQPQAVCARKRHSPCGMCAGIMNLTRAMRELPAIYSGRGPVSGSTAPAEHRGRGNC